MSTQGAKLLTLILAGTCGVLLLLAIALQVGLGRGYSWLPVDPDAASVVGTGTIDRTPFKLPAETDYVATQERPLFNEDRKPTPEEPADDTGQPQPPSAPLNVALTGIILTPDLRIAMVQDKTKNLPVSLKEGMPMPGDQGGWTLTRINPRSAIFRETGGDEIEVELMTAVASPRATAPGRPGAPTVPGQARVSAPTPGTAPVAAAAPGSNPQSEALQRRIEERRKQMRDEAEKMKQQQQQQPQQQPQL